MSSDPGDVSEICSNPGDLRENRRESAAGENFWGFCIALAQETTENRCFGKDFTTKTLWGSHGYSHVDSGVLIPIF